MQVPVKLFFKIIRIGEYAIINTYLLGARETVCFVIPRPGDVSRGAAEGNIAGRGITKHTAFPRAQ